MNTFYIPHHNMFTTPIWGSLPAFLVLYALIIGFSLIYYLEYRDKFIWIKACWVGFFIVLILQTAAQKKVFDYYQKKNFSRLTVLQRKASMLGPSYRVATQIRRYMGKNRCQGRLLTDLDHDKDLEPSILKYYLYPKVNLFNDGKAADCLVAYNKDKPGPEVPADFEVVRILGRNASFALRKD